MAFGPSALYGHATANILTGACDAEFDRADCALFHDSTYSGNVDGAAYLGIGDLGGELSNGVTVATVQVAGYSRLTSLVMTLTQVADGNIEYKTDTNPVFPSLTAADLGGIVFFDDSSTTPASPADIALVALAFDAIGSAGGGNFTVNLSSLTVFTLNPEPSA